MNRTRFVVSLAALAAIGITISPVHVARAQAPDRPATSEQTLISRPITNGGYGAPVQRLSVVAGKSVLLTGLEGGWIINHRFVLGAAGYGLATQNVRHTGSSLRDSKGRAPVVEMGYGGVLLGYVPEPMRRAHVNVQTIIGGGGMTYDVSDVAGMRLEDAPADGFFVIEPSLEAEVKVTSIFRIALGGGYRFISGARLDGLRDDDLRGASMSLSFKLGRF
jgi:hypothetical protein